MQKLLREISRHHFPHPPASPQEIEAFEKRVGWQLDPDLRAFYLHCNGADLFKHPDSPYRIHSLSQIIRARVAIRGKDDDSRGPASWYAICSLYDSNYILIDVGSQSGGRYPIIDGQGETFPDPDYCQPIAASFSAFLTEALSSQGRWFWLEPRS